MSAAPKREIGEDTARITRQLFAVALNDAELAPVAHRIEEHAGGSNGKLDMSELWTELADKLVERIDEGRKERGGGGGGTRGRSVASLLLVALLAIAGGAVSSYAALRQSLGERASRSEVDQAVEAAAKDAAADRAVNAGNIRAAVKSQQDQQRVLDQLVGDVKRIDEKLGDMKDDLRYLRRRSGR